MRQMESTSDAELLGALSGDVRAFGTFYRRYMKRVTAFAARRCSPLLVGRRRRRRRGADVRAAARRGRSLRPVPGGAGGVHPRDGRRLGDLGGVGGREPCRGRYRGGRRAGAPPAGAPEGVPDDGFAVWIDPETHLLVRAQHPSGRDQVTLTFDYLPRTPELLARLGPPTVPDGYTLVDPEAGEGQLPDPEELGDIGLGPACPD
jgi:hypothetical protein